jgi:hypothetical protein
MLVPIILGADKTTVSVQTGNTEFHPVYVSIGNVHNGVRRAHKDALLPLAFLSIPKGKPHLLCKTQRTNAMYITLFAQELVKMTKIQAIEPLRSSCIMLR